jgi:hypothetical protein
MLLPHALRAASNKKPIEYIGAVKKEAAQESSWDSSGEALNVLSVATTGDLVVIAFSFDAAGDSAWSWAGMPFTAVYNNTSGASPGAYVGYRFVQAGDSNPYISGIAAPSTWEGLTVVASVFRNVRSFVNSGLASGTTGMPNPPALTASGKLWVATGHLDDDVVTNWGAPANYTLSLSAAYTDGTNASSTAIAYRIATLSSDDPGAFTGSGSDDWRATTLAFT